MSTPESLSLEIVYTWQPVEVQPGMPFRYPGSVNESIRSRWSRPAVYRWRVCEGDTILAVAVGESENLARTLSEYNAPKTSSQSISRIKGALSEFVLLGSAIELDALVAQSIQIAGQALSEAALKEGAIRRIVENLVTYHARQTGLRVLSGAPVKPTLPF